MGSERNPASVRASELLSDGQWQDLDWVLLEMGKLIPPGKAMRETERKRRNSLRYKGYGETSRKHSTAETERLVATGKRLLAMDMLRNLKVEFDPPSRGGRARAKGRKVRLPRT